MMYSIKKRKVPRLKKDMYEIKQFPRAWFGHFTSAMVRNKHILCQTNYILLVKHQVDKMTALIVYVDCIVVTGNDEAEMK